MVNRTGSFQSDNVQPTTRNAPGSPAVCMDAWDVYLCEANRSKPKVLKRFYLCQIRTERVKMSDREVSRGPLGDGSPQTGGTSCSRLGDRWRWVHAAGRGWASSSSPRPLRADVTDSAGNTFKGLILPSWETERQESRKTTDERIGRPFNQDMFILFRNSKHLLDPHWTSIGFFFFFSHTVEVNCLLTINTGLE